MSGGPRHAVITHPGMAVPPRSFGPVTQTDIVRFAGAGGDFNPLHHDPDAATAAGFERPIAMGQLTAGVIGGWISDWAGIEHLHGLKVRFTSPLQIGDTLELTGSVARLDSDDWSPGTGTAYLELRAAVGERVVATATARVATVTA